MRYDMSLFPFFEQLYLLDFSNILFNYLRYGNVTIGQTINGKKEGRFFIENESRYEFYRYGHLYKQCSEIDFILKRIDQQLKLIMKKLKQLEKNPKFRKRLKKIIETCKKI